MDVIYADAVFFRNAVLDALLLWLCARVLNRRVKPLRLWAAASVGGLYAALCALPPLRWLGTLPAAAAASAALCFVSFGRAGFGKCWTVFLMLAAGVAGAVMGLGRLLSESGGVRAASPQLVFLSFALCYALVRFFILRRLRSRRRQTAAVCVSLAGREAAFTALCDTGNSLCDPITGSPVLIADAEGLAPLFESPLPALPTDGAEAFRRLSGRGELRGRLRLVPYSAVGTARGMLPAFRPDRVTVDGEATNHLVALSPTNVGDGEYRAVL